MIELSNLQQRLEQVGFSVDERNQIVSSILGCSPISSALQTRLDNAGKGPADGFMFASQTLSQLADTFAFQTFCSRMALHVAAQSGSSAQATARAAVFTALNALV
jgi:hypothetical protein